MQVELATHSGRGGSVERGAESPSFRRLRQLAAIGLIAVGAATLLNDLDGLGTQLRGVLVIGVGGLMLLPARRAVEMLLSYATYLVLIGLFAPVRAVADNTALRNHVTHWIPELERWLFVGMLPSAALQRWFYDATSPRLTDYLLAVVYFSFFVAPLLTAIIVPLVSPPLFRLYVVTTAFVSVIGLAICFALPTMPPWMAADELKLDEPVTRGAYQVITWFTSYEMSNGERTMVVGDANPLAAMPSFHTAATAIFFFMAMHTGGRIRRPATLVYLILMGVSLVYFGEHYVLDIAAGVLVAWVSWRLAVRLLAATWMPEALAVRPRLGPPLKSVGTGPFSTAAGSERAELAA